MMIYNITCIVVVLSFVRLQILFMFVTYLEVNYTVQLLFGQFFMVLWTILPRKWHFLRKYTTFIVNLDLPYTDFIDHL